MHLDVSVDLGAEGQVYPVDPRISDRRPISQRHAMMGDISKSSANEVSVWIEVQAPSPILQIDLLNGAQVISTHRPYTEADIGNRVRVTWQGAEYRGRGRQTYWNGQILVNGAEIARMERFNHWNHDRIFQQTGASEVTYDVVTTGNYVGCDLWITDDSAHVKVENALAPVDTAIKDIPFNGLRVDAGGLDRNITLMRLPEHLAACEMSIDVSVALSKNRDNPIWVRVKTEDGHTAWSSPIYVMAD